MAQVGQVASGLQGTVRSYNGSKGFGFITGQGAFADVMFSRHELPEDAREVRGKFIEGRVVTFDATIKPDGRAKATAVQIIAGEGLQLSGIVKNYNPQNGYGFVSSHSLPGGDVYFPKSAFGNLADGAQLQGALVLFEAAPKPDGKMACTRIQFQTAKIAEKVNASGFGMGMMMGMPGMMGGNANMAQQMAMMQAMQAQQGGGMKRGADMMMGGAFKQQKVDVPTTSTGQFMQGTVKSYNNTKGWGLIQSPGIPSGGAGQPGDVFFMRSNLPQVQREGNVDVTGMNVQYELTQTADGRYRAQNIAIV
eukprot:TRINITY_DN147_c0_g2_i3.p2 TRINITY_DN147_c0_g2~~TRINITY_DN147_c0_g2_i3.p2  ORF type:complete len:307 (-),score=88.06 TRINITY_DN147_c0_g2_i3:319-1239(-)